MEIAIFGAKNTGKSTLFSILCGIEATGFSTEAQVGMCEIPDNRIEYLSTKYNPKKKIYAKIKVVDIPGAEKGEMFSVKNLNNCKASDALIYMIRTFKNDSVPKENLGSPIDEIKNFEEEILLSDLTQVETRIERLNKSMLKRKEKENELELKLMHKLKEHLDKNNPLRTLELTDDDSRKVRGFTFLSIKPVLFVLNIDENEIDKNEAIVSNYKLNTVSDQYHRITSMCCSIEKDIAKMSLEEKKEFLKDYGITEDAKNKLIHLAFDLLNHICFLTVGADEVRSWPVKKGTNAKEAAGTIHSDIEKGFIKAEIFHYNDFEKYGNEEKIKELKLVHLEGKEYLVKDGDIVHFRFNI